MTRLRIAHLVAPVLFAALATFPARPVEAERPRPFSARTETTSPDLEAPIPGRIELSDDSMRFEVTRDGVSTALLAGPHIEGVVMLVPDQQVALEMPNPPDGPPEVEAVDPDDPCEGMEGVDCNKLRAEALNGRMTQVWEITDGQSVSTIWIDEELHFPIKVEESNGTRFEIQDVTVGEPPAERFQIPDDYRRMRMPAEPSPEEEPGTEPSPHGEPGGPQDPAGSEPPGTQTQ